MGACHIIIIFFTSTHYTFFHLHARSFKCFVIVVNHHVNGHIVNMICILTLFVYFYHYVLPFRNKEFIIIIIIIIILFYNILYEVI